MATDPKTLSALLGSGAQPDFSSEAKSAAAGQSGDVGGVITFGDQIVNGSKGSIWNLLIITAAAVYVITAVLLPKKKKQ